MGIDLNLFYFFNNLAGKTSWLDNIFIFFADYFQYLVGLIFLALLIRSAYSQRQKMAIFFVTIISALFSRLAVTSLVRFFYHHPRPFAVHSVHQLISESGYSFPSGHAAFFFAFSGAIYAYNKNWGIFFFICSTIISLSRIMAGIHYPSDILGGLVVGLLSAYLFVYLEKKFLKMSNNF